MKDVVLMLLEELNEKELHAVYVFMTCILGLRD